MALWRLARCIWKLSMLSSISRRAWSSILIFSIRRSKQKMTVFPSSLSITLDGTYNLGLEIGGGFRGGVCCKSTHQKKILPKIILLSSDINLSAQEIDHIYQPLITCIKETIREEKFANVKICFVCLFISRERLVNNHPFPFARDASSLRLLEVVDLENQLWHEFFRLFWI